MSTNHSYEPYDLGLPDFGIEDETTERLRQVIDEFHEATTEDANQYLGSVICASLTPFARRGVRSVELDPTNVDILTQDTIVVVYSALVNARKASPDKTPPLAHNPRGYVYVSGKRTAQRFRMNAVQRRNDVSLDAVAINSSGNTRYYEYHQDIASDEDIEGSVISEIQTRNIINILLRTADIPERSRDILILKTSGMPQREIAAKLDIPMGNIGPSVYRAQQRLASYLIEQGYSVPRRFQPKPKKLKDTAA